MRTVRRDGYDDDERDGIIEDGRSMRFPLLLKDGQRALHDGMGHPAGYRSGFVFSGNTERHDAYDEARRAATAAYDEMCKRATEAWRMPLHRDTAEPDTAEALLRRPLGTAEPGADDAARAERIRARTRAEYLDQLSNAWRKIGRAHV